MMTALVDEFDQKWLESVGTNPVQLLWKRNDPLAFNELCQLGDAILRGKSANKDWVKRRIRTIKLADSNNRKGSLFELLALSMFVRRDVKIVPAPEDNPGYDVTVILPSGGAMKISLKNYGLSASYSSFKKRCREVENSVVTWLKERAINAVVITVFFTEYPNQEDWTKLEEDLVCLIEKFKTCCCPKMLQAASYELSIDRLSDHEFSSNYQSYTLRFFCPYYQNEHKKLTD